MSGYIYVGDVGTDLIITVYSNGSVRDVSSATTKQIILKSPTGVSATKAAEFVSDGTDGKIKYRTQAGDISASGSWRMQGYVNLGAWSGYTTTVPFEVRDPL